MGNNYKDFFEEFEPALIKKYKDEGDSYHKKPSEYGLGMASALCWAVRVMKAAAFKHGIPMEDVSFDPDIHWPKAKGGGNG